MVSFLDIIAQKLQKRVDMIDIKLLQNDFEKTSISLQKKGVSIEVLENLQTLAQNTKQQRQMSRMISQGFLQAPYWYSTLPEILIKNTGNIISRATHILQTGISIIS